MHIYVESRKMVQQMKLFARQEWTQAERMDLWTQGAKGRPE